MKKNWKDYFTKGFFEWMEVYLRKVIKGFGGIKKMNVLILHGSCRVNGVTGQLADEFAHGAKDADIMLRK